MASPGREGRRERAVAVGLFALITALAIAGLVFNALHEAPLWPNGLVSVIVYPFALVGALIAWRRPRNPIAWLCLTIGLAFALEGALWEAALYGFARPGVVSRPEVLAVVGDAFVMPGLFLIATLLLLLFPDGRLPSPRWRWVAWLSGGLIGWALLVGLFAPATGGWGRPSVENPWAIEAANYLDWTLFLLFGCVVASVVAMVRRFRGATGVERLQLRWLVTAGAAATVVWVIAIFLVEPFAGENAAVAATVGGFVMVPLAIGVAVLRYRLFDIDRLVSRTVTYGLVVGVLGGAYAGGVLLLGRLIPAQSELAVAASTLAVAALFNPLRRGVQTRVDRRFNRSRYDAERELERFAGRLRDEYDLDELSDDLITVVGSAMEPSAASVWIRR